MKQRTDSQGVPYSYLVDNIKVVLIFLVVFNHLIAFQLVKVDMVVRYVWYGITIFHMPAFIFISGYFAKVEPKKILSRIFPGTNRCKQCHQRSCICCEYI